MGAKIFSPLGICRIVYKFPTGQYAVEFEHGGGHIFTREELFPYQKMNNHGEKGQHGQVCRQHVPGKLLSVLSGILESRFRREAG